MRIALDGRAKKFTGIDIYTQALYQKLVAHGHPAYLYNDDIGLTRDNTLKKYVNSARRRFKEQFGLRTWLLENKIDLFHATMNTDVPLFSPVPVVVTIHDIIPHMMPAQYLSSQIERIYYETFIRIAIERSTHILTESMFSKQEMVAQYHISPEKITVIPIGYNRAFRPIKSKDDLNSVKAKYHLPDKYILTIGGSEYRKNVDRMIQVYLENFVSQISLVVIGGAWRNVDLPKKYADKPIIFLKGIPEDDLVAIYNMATIFVFPSLYEGFGIPVLEGMACNVPVVTSNVSSMPEVGGRAAVYFDPYKKEDMAEKIDMVLKNAQLRTQLIQKGEQQARLFSWDACYNQTARIYERLIELSKTKSRKIRD
jgi:glycosyltransferase involved in cell wall biosynthesis